MIRLYGRDIVMPQACVLTVGKFESLHRGHRTLITEAVRRARELGLASAVATFEPHPRTVLHDPTYQPLFTTAERARILQEIGVDYLLAYPFDHMFAALSPEAFCVMLFGSLRARVVVVGDGYRFGNGRTGTVETLRQHAGAYAAEVVVIGTVTDGAKTIGTSGIRSLIASRSMQEAAEWLGFPFFMLGEVTHGQKIGRTLGFPTVNVRPVSHRFLPPDGVYATRTRTEVSVYGSVTNIGIRPTVADKSNTERTVESFLIGFDGDLYGETLKTEFLTFLRPEQRFENVDALRQQIHQNVQEAAHHF